MKKILIIGATSGIAEATGKLFAAQKAQLYLLARNQEHLISLARDLKVRGATSVEHHTFDVEDLPQCHSTLERVLSNMGHIDIVLIAHGYLPEQTVCDNSVEKTLQALHINALSTIALLINIANHLERQKHGIIAVITSIAGDCPRYSNYVYSTSKNMVSSFLQGLRSRLYKNNIHVLTIKPGPVDTPMTKAFKKNFLWASAENVAQGIVSAVKRKKEVVYLPKFWRPIMFLLKVMPQSYFKKINVQHAKKHSET
jgi:decaprenylphospho-beta-D-erythro-pentofuranosid-2-ulose 2-reductase